MLICLAVRQRPRWGRTDLSEDDATVFSEGIGEWDNRMAAGMMPLDQEVAAFGDVMPISPPDNNNGLNHRI